LIIVLFWKRETPCYMDDNSPSVPFILIFPLFFSPVNSPVTSFFPPLLNLSISVSDSVSSCQILIANLSLPSFSQPLIAFFSSCPCGVTAFAFLKVSSFFLKTLPRVSVRPVPSHFPRAHVLALLGLSSRFVFFPGIPHSTTKTATSPPLCSALTLLSFPIYGIAKRGEAFNTDFSLVLIFPPIAAGRLNLPVSFESDYLRVILFQSSTFSFPPPV